MATRYELKGKVGITTLGAGVWNIGPGNDPFGGPTRDAIPMLERLPMLAEAGMSYYEAHDVEIPAADAAKANKIAKACGLKCAMYTPSFFSAPVFKDGAMTSNDPAVRKLGLANALKAVDTTVDLGAKTMVFWNGREGFDFVLADEIEHALARGIPLLAACIVAAAEDALEDELGVHFFGQRLSRRAPRHRAGIDARIPAVAAARHVAGLAADLQRGEMREFAHARGGELVHRSPGADVGAVGLPRLAAGEERGHRPCVVAAAVAVRARFIGGEAGEHIHVALEGRERLQDFRQLEVLALGLRRPIRHVLAVRHIDERHARGRGLLHIGTSSPCTEIPHRLQPRKSDDGAESTEQSAARKLVHFIKKACAE